MLIVQQDIYIRAGSTEIFEIAVQKANGSAEDCTGATLRMELWDKVNNVKLAAAACAWTNAAGGIGAGVFDAATTAAIATTGIVCSDYSRYAYDVEVAFPTGEVERVSNGFGLVSPEVTK